MAGAAKYEISLGSVAPAAAIADRLIAELAGQGVDTEVAPDGTIWVKAVSVPSLTVVASLLFRMAERGLRLDLTGGDAVLRIADDLPRGSVLILRQDGREDRRDSMTGQQTGYLMRTALAAVET
jgi:hypothetical protein